VTMTGLEVRNCERAVDRRVHGDRHDHCLSLRERLRKRLNLGSKAPMRTPFTNHTLDLLAQPGDQDTQPQM
jgi:hypothetical protein